MIAPVFVLFIGPHLLSSKRLQFDVEGGVVLKYVLSGVCNFVIFGHSLRQHQLISRNHL